MQDLALVFQGLSAGAAIVNAFKSMLDIHKITREDLLALEAKANSDALLDTDRALAAASELSGLDPDDEELIEKKLKEAKKRWHDKISNTDDPAQWAQATDERRASQCALMRTIRQLKGGTLPPQWYKLWTELQCA
ncbi:hypothetical protein D3C71_273710 [compost metagenome]